MTSVCTSEALRRLIIIFVLVLVSACGATVEDGDRELARVNAHIITVGDFERSYVNVLLQSGANDSPDNRWDHLERLLDDYLLYEEALRHGLGDDSLTIGFEELALGKALGGRYYEQALLQTLPLVDEPAVRRAYARFKQPIIARHLLYRSMDEADAAYARLLAGRSFLAEAQDCFQTTEFDSLAGYLGEVRYFQVDDAFAEAAFALAVGHYSAPVRGRHGYHIILVEDRFAAPILTESDYQMRRLGLASLLRLRQRRLHGDRFVRSFMESLDVRVESEGIRVLQEALNRLELRTGGAPVVIGNDDSRSRSVLSPETPLATYWQSGSQYVFTAEDYSFWLPDLPFKEAVNKTAASVGRALRNEAFARAGRNAGLENSRQVVSDMDAERRVFLAARMRAQSTSTALAPLLRKQAAISVDSVLFSQIMSL